MPRRTGEYFVRFSGRRRVRIGGSAQGAKSIREKNPCVRLARVRDARRFGLSICPPRVQGVGTIPIPLRLAHARARERRPGWQPLRAGLVGVAEGKTCVCVERTLGRRSARPKVHGFRSSPARSSLSRFDFASVAPSEKDPGLRPAGRDVLCRQGSVVAVRDGLFLDRELRSMDRLVREFAELLANRAERGLAERKALPPGSPKPVSDEDS